jgi:hypothetical protein
MDCVIEGLALIGRCHSEVSFQFPNLDVAGSNPVARSILF